MNEFPGYDTRHEETMRLYYRSLPEDHRRRYAAVAITVTAITRRWNAEKGSGKGI